MVKKELGLCYTAYTVKGLKMSARHHDGIAIRQDKGPLKQASLLHTGVGVRQFDVVHINKLMPCEQTYAVESPTELDGRSKQSFHAAIVG